MPPLTSMSLQESTNDPIFMNADLFTTRPVLSIAVLGVAKTGKSSFISNVTKDFNPSQKSDKDITTKRRIERREDSENEFVKLCMYETNSIERFHAITKGYHRKWDIVFILYNTNFGYSLKRAVKWVKDIRSHGPQNPKLVLVENTFEIEYSSQLSDLERQELNTELINQRVDKISGFSLDHEEPIASVLQKVVDEKILHCESETASKTEAARATETMEKEQ